jgi:hypothetical protein
MDTDVVYFDRVRSSAQQMIFADSRSGEAPYIAGIRTLTRGRPYSTLYDLELFLKAWFLAEKCLGRNADTK